MRQKEPHNIDNTIAINVVKLATKGENWLKLTPEENISRSDDAASTTIATSLSSNSGKKEHDTILGYMIESRPMHIIGEKSVFRIGVLMKFGPWLAAIIATPLDMAVVMVFNPCPRKEG